MGDSNIKNEPIQYLVMGFDKPYGDNKLVSYQLLEQNRFVNGTLANRLLPIQFPIDKQPNLFDMVCIDTDKNGFNTPGKLIGSFPEKALKVYAFLASDNLSDNIPSFETIRNDRIKIIEAAKETTFDQTLSQTVIDNAIKDAEKFADINFATPVECVVEGYIEKYTKLKTTIKTPSGLSIGIWHHDLVNPFKDIGIGSADSVRAYGKLKNGDMNAYLYGIKKYIPEVKTIEESKTKAEKEEIKSKPTDKEDINVKKGLDDCEETEIPKQPFEKNDSISEKELSSEKMCEIATELKHKFHCKTLQSASLQNEYLLVWKDGYYQKSREGVIRTAVDKLLGNHYTINWFNTVLNKIKSIEEPIKWSEFVQRPYTANLENGIIDYSGDYQIKKEDIDSGDVIDLGDGVVFIRRWDKDGKEKDFHDYNFDYKIPIKFDQKAECPNVVKIMQEILVDGDMEVTDKDYYKKYMTFIEYLGSILMDTNETKEVITLLAKTNHGKSTLLNIVQQFAGKENVCAVSVQDMTKQFGGATLDGALANVVDEITYINAHTIDKFKSIASGSPIEIEKKTKDRYTIKPKCKMIMAGNKTFGMSLDVKEDFMSRIVCLELKNLFTEKKGKGKVRSSRIKDKIYSPEELSGLMNLAIGGLSNLLQRGRYNHDKSDDYELWLKYERAINEAEQFIEEKLEYSSNPNCTLDKDEVYEQYKIWYRAHNLPMADIVPPNTLSHNVQMFFGEQIKTIYIDDLDESDAKGRRVRKPHWRYLSYRVSMIGNVPVVDSNVVDSINIPENKAERDELTNTPIQWQSK